MTKNQMQKWTKALRSGKFKQGQFKLKEDGKYCCLGVLCEINGFSTHGSYLSKSAQRFLKMRTKMGTINKTYRIRTGFQVQSLGDLNDGGLSFKQIANIIEKNYKDL